MLPPLEVDGWTAAMTTFRRNEYAESFPSTSTQAPTGRPTVPQRLLARNLNIAASH